MENEENTPVAEDKVTEEVSTETEAPEVAPTEAPAEEETPVGEMVEKEEKRVVDQAIFVSEKKARKAAEKELKALKKSIEEGASDAEVSQSLTELAQEHNVDPKFLSKFAATVRKEASEEIESKISEQFESKEKQAKFNDAFDKAFGKALERAPDFNGIANPDIIKTLALQPENSKKTVSQLLEEIYGNAIPGKRTVETTKPGGGKEPQPLDYDRAQSDSAYFKEIMDNPTLKKKYNETALEAVTRYL